MTLFGPYTLIRRLGAGATAEVFLAQGPNPRNAELLALKLILPHLAEDGGSRAMLLREARAVSVVRHPNVVELYEVGEVQGRTFLSMEYVAGFALNALVRTLREKNEKLSLAEAAHVVREAALGLHHAHEAVGEDGQPLGLIHRDVSPHNLMLSGDGRIKVVDFGLARATHASATLTGGLKGKLRYMPPEQLRSEPLDRRVDVFALGAILWELALGQPLYPGPTEADIFQQALFAPQPHPDEVARGLPRAFVEVLTRATARDPSARYQTAQDLAGALEPFVAANAVASLSQRMSRLLGRAPRSGAEANELAVNIDLTRAQTGSVPTVSESLVPPEIGARAPAPPPAPLHTPQETRRAPALEPLPRVVRSQSKKRAAPPPVGYTPASQDTEPGASPLPRSRTGQLVRAVTSTLVRRWRRREYLRWGALAAVALFTTLGLLVLLRARAANDAASPQPDPVTAKAPPTEAALPPPPPEPQAEKPERAPAPTRRGTRGTLVLTSDSPAFVKAGQKDLGMTPLTVELAAGRHKLSLRSVDGHKGALVDVEVPKDGVVERQVALEPL